LKPERWGSPLVQEKYREEKACDKRHPYRIIIIMIIIIIEQHVMKLHIMQFSASFCFCLLPRPKLTSGQAPSTNTVCRSERKINCTNVKLERRLLEISRGADFRVRNMSA
jgi:hypothetical protein